MFMDWKTHLIISQFFKIDIYVESLLFPNKIPQPLFYRKMTKSDSKTYMEMYRTKKSLDNIEEEHSRKS